MGLESLPKYMVLSRLIWQIVRPFAVAVAKNSRNTTIDDDLISAVDAVLSSTPVEFENEIAEKKVRHVI